MQSSPDNHQLFSSLDSEDFVGGREKKGMLPSGRKRQSITDRHRKKTSLLYQTLSINDIILLSTTANQHAIRGISAYL